MSGRRFFVAVLIVILLTGVSVADLKSSSGCIEKDLGDKTDRQRSNDDLFYPEDYDKDRNIVKRITGEMSDSRKMGIGVLLVLISSVLYAGFK